MTAPGDDAPPGSPHDSLPSRASVRYWIEQLGSALAEHYQLDVARVSRILVRTVRDRYGTGLAQRLDQEVEPGDLWWSPRLDEALVYLAPSDALTLFETADLDALRQREGLIHFLWQAGPFFPLAGLDEMADLVEAFLTYRERERPHLLRTGLPLRRFAGIGWLSWQLFYLYPTRFLKQGGPPPPDEDEPILVVWPERLEDAPPIPGLGDANLLRLEGLRPRFYDLEEAILREFAAALRARTAVGLWERCLALLTEALLADDVDLSLHADRCYVGFDVREGLDSTAKAHIPSGGLTGLLVLIGDVEEAISLGTYARLRAALGSVVTPGQQPGRWHLLVTSYYQLVNQPGWQQQGAALDALLALGPRRAAFWQEHRRRVNQALDEEFDVVLPANRVKRKHRVQVEPFFRSLFDMVCAHVEATGTLPSVRGTLSLATGADAEARNLFRREGKFYTIRYGGRVVRVPTTVGWRYIAHLVHHERREFHALQLVALIKGRQTKAADAQLSELTEEMLAEFNLSVSGLGDAGELLDEQAIKEYRQAWRDYQEDLREAEQANDLERVAQLQEALAHVEQEVTKAVGLGGRKRKAADAKEKARKAISVAISRDLRDIKHEHPALYEHLDAGLRRGDFFVYEPATSPRWQQ